MHGGVDDASMHGERNRVQKNRQERRCGQGVAVVFRSLNFAIGVTIVFRWGCGWVLDDVGKTRGDFCVSHDSDWVTFLFLWCSRRWSVRVFRRELRPSTTSDRVLGGGWLGGYRLWDLRKTESVYDRFDRGRSKG